MLDPMEAPDMELTDIMVAPTTDPAWAPLFLSVGGRTAQQRSGKRERTVSVTIRSRRCQFAGPPTDY